MFEVMEFMKEPDYKQRIRAVVTDDVNFDLKGIAYLKYWEEKRKLTEKAIAEHHQEAIKPLEEKRDEEKLIEKNIMEFIGTVRDIKYIPSKELSKSYNELYEIFGIEINDDEIIYDIVNEKNVSTGIVRRCSINVLINKNYPTCDIKDALKKIVYSSKIDNDVIWIFVYNNLDDIPKSNWFCEGYWVSSMLDQRWRPANLGSNDQIEDIKIKWRPEYKSLKKVYQPYSGTKNELLKFTDSLVEQMVPIAKTAIKKFDQFQNGEIDEKEFLDYMYKERQIESELYTQSMERKFATYECNDYIQIFDGLFAIVDNMFLYYLTESTDAWSNEDKRILMNLDKNNFYKELDELKYERKKLK